MMAKCGVLNAMYSLEITMQVSKTIGQIAFEAHQQTSDGYVCTGDWNKLAPSIRDAWEVSANAVWKELLDRTDKQIPLA